MSSVKMDEQPLETAQYRDSWRAQVQAHVQQWMHVCWYDDYDNDNVVAPSDHTVSKSDGA